MFEPFLHQVPACSVSLLRHMHTASSPLYHQAFVLKTLNYCPTHTKGSGLGPLAQCMSALRQQHDGRKRGNCSSDGALSCPCSWATASATCCGACCPSPCSCCRCRPRLSRLLLFTPQSCTCLAYALCAHCMHMHKPRQLLRPVRTATSACATRSCFWGPMPALRGWKTVSKTTMLFAIGSVFLFTTGGLIDVVSASSGIDVALRDTCCPTRVRSATASS